MRKVLILGASGRIGSQVMRRLLTAKGVTQTLYVRNPDKLPKGHNSKVAVLTGDLLDIDNLHSAMQGQDIVVAVVSGDLLNMARSIVSAVKDTSVSRLIWMTGMGIHHEVPGETGKKLDSLLKQFPEYAEAADLIVDSGVDYTLIRGSHLTDGNNSNYFLQKEGEELHSEFVDRCAVARFIVDMITDEGDLGKNKSLGITN